MRRAVAEGLSQLQHPRPALPLQVRLAMAHGRLMLQRLEGEVAALPWLGAIQQRTGIPRVYSFLVLSAAA